MLLNNSLMVEAKSQSNNKQPEIEMYKIISQKLDVSCIDLRGSSSAAAAALFANQSLRI